MTPAKLSRRIQCLMRRINKEDRTISFTYRELGLDGRSVFVRHGAKSSATYFPPTYAVIGRHFSANYKSLEELMRVVLRVNEKQFQAFYDGFRGDYFNGDFSNEEFYLIGQPLRREGQALNAALNAKKAKAAF
jgi:hypothetical protein